MELVVADAYIGTEQCSTYAKNFPLLFPLLFSHWCKTSFTQWSSTRCPSLTRWSENISQAFLFVVFTVHVRTFSWMGWLWTWWEWFCLVPVSAVTQTQQISTGGESPPKGINRVQASGVKALTLSFPDCLLHSLFCALLLPVELSCFCVCGNSSLACAN